MDEVEKVFPSSRGGDRDGGVGARMEGTWLTAVNDMTEPVFFVYTANDVRRMHEAFFRAERVDAAFYVQLPDEIQRAAVWKLYLSRYFPAQVNGKAYPRYAELDVDELLVTWSKGKGKGISQPLLNKFSTALMTLAPAEREAAIAKIQVATGVTPENLRTCLIDDKGWTPAEIKSCCRLARKLNEPITETCKRVRPVSVSSPKVFHSLDEWAADSALDAETGQLYVRLAEREVEEEAEADEGATPKKRFRRKVRHA
jgi:SpoVK/Ycf46/Vps4 family AAA+-type ATPase